MLSVTGTLEFLSAGVIDNFSSVKLRKYAHYLELWSQVNVAHPWDIKLKCNGYLNSKPPVDGIFYATEPPKTRDTANTVRISKCTHWPALVQK
jgi:hypothetical protein